MRRELVRRLERLELRLARKRRWPISIWLMQPLAEDERNALADGERIVHDLYRDFAGIVYARERITADPFDEGRDCAQGGYLEDVIRELHERCEWKERGCNTCSGLGLFE